MCEEVIRGGSAHTNGLLVWVGGYGSMSAGARIRHMAKWNVRSHFKEVETYRSLKQQWSSGTLGGLDRASVGGGRRHPRWGLLLHLSGAWLRGSRCESISVWF